MTITAVTHAKWWGAPGPMICGPKSLYPQTGYWGEIDLIDDVLANFGIQYVTNYITFVC